MSMSKPNSFCSHKYTKLSFLLAVLLWLVLKSPITFIPFVSVSGLSESNPGVIYYFYLEFTVWILFMLPGLFYIFSKSDLKTWIYTFRYPLLICINFCYAMLRIFRTFDVTDTGFHFTKAWGLFHGSQVQNVDFIVGTSFVNGLWLSIIGSPNVLWARFGYVLLVTAISLVSYKIFARYFDRLIDWFLFLVLSLFFIHFNYYLSINYDNLPVLLALFGIWFLVKEKKSAWLYFISGLFFGLTIWMKFNFILIVILPLAFGWILYEKKEPWLRKTLFVYAGYGLSFILGLSLLAATGNIKTYVDYIDQNLINKEEGTNQGYNEKLDGLIKQKTFSGDSTSKDSEDKFFFLTESQKNTSERKEIAYLKDDVDSHSLRRLFNVYFYGFWIIVKSGTLFSVLLVLILLLTGEMQGAKRWMILSVFSFMFYYITYWNMDGSDFIFLSTLIFPAYLYILFCLRFQTHLIEPTLLILMVALFSFPGSDLSFNVIYRSGMGLLFYSFPLAFMVNKNIRVGGQAFILNNYVFILLFAVILGIAKPWGYNNSHRDIGDRSVLVEMFKSPQLFGIHTFPQRVEVIDEALEFFKNEKYEKNNTPALFLSWIPMMYYLTETNCITNNPWHGCVLFRDFKDEFDRVSKDAPPEYITFSKVMTRNPGWPLLDDEYREKDKAWVPDLKKFDYIRYWMKDKKYEKVFENNMFEIYKRVRSDIRTGIKSGNILLDCPEVSARYLHDQSGVSPPFKQSFKKRIDG